MLTVNSGSRIVDDYELSDRVVSRHVVEEKQMNSAMQLRTSTITETGLLCAKQEAQKVSCARFFCSLC